MKRFLVCILGVMFCLPVGAMTRCVALSADTTSCAYKDPGNRTPNWQSFCTTNGTTTTFNGTSLCMATGGNLGDYNVVWNSQYYISTDASENKHCWCNLITPIQTWWAYASTFSSYRDCINSCSAACSNGMHTSAVFRQALYQHVR